MPAFAVLIAPLLALYIKFKLVSVTVKLLLFLSIYFSFKATMDWGLNQILSRLDTLNFPCMISYILNGLDVFTMINFALSFYATVYIGKFFYNSLTRFL